MTDTRQPPTEQAPDVRVLLALIDQQARDLAELRAQLEAVELAATGVGVSDFMESFPAVRAVAELRAQQAATEQALEEFNMQVLAWRDDPDERLSAHGHGTAMVLEWLGLQREPASRTP